MHTFRSPRCTAALSTLLVLSLSACAGPNASAPSQAATGQSVRATLASQIAHPEAVRNNNPVNGVDGVAALKAQQKYEKSFSKSATEGDASSSVMQQR
jgi:hypothetical protein